MASGSKRASYGACFIHVHRVICINIRLLNRNIVQFNEFDKIFSFTVIFFIFNIHLCVAGESLQNEEENERVKAIENGSPLHIDRCSHDACLRPIACKHMSAYM